MASFTLKIASNGEFAFTLDADGANLLRSETYKAKASAVNGIDSVRKNSQIDSRYDPETSSNGKFYYNLKASNGQVVGTSPMYADEAARAAAIAKVKAEAEAATLDDQA
jgi:uncharacterized protein YegP (UPF0339 family)